MTAFDLLDDPTFTGLCKVWAHDGSCPAGLVDYLISRGLYAQSEGAEWARSEKPVRWGQDDGLGNIRPYRNNSGTFGWNMEIPGDDHFRSSIPRDVFDAMKEHLATTAAIAIAKLLDAWAKVRPIKTSTETV